MAPSNVFSKWAIAVQRVLHSQQRTNALTHLLIFQRLPMAITTKFCSKSDMNCTVHVMSMGKYTSKMVVTS